MLGSTTRVYCAGPLFNRAERGEMTAIADVLVAAGFAVYLPHRDGMEFRHVHQALQEQGWPAPEAGRFLHAAIFALDVFQLVSQCQAVVWNLNGRTPDEGAVSEAAIAWTLGKPIVAYKDDVRTLITGRDNPLLAGLVEFQMVDDMQRLPAAVSSSLESTPHDATHPLPDAVRRAVSQGRELWGVLQSQRAQGDNRLIADLVAQTFGPARRP